MYLMCTIGLDLVNIHPAFFQNVAILYTISRQIAISTDICRKCRMGMTFIQANITLSTLPGLNLLVAIRANQQINYAVLTFCDFQHRVI